MSKVRFGLSNVHIAKRIVSEDGIVTYDTPKKYPGAVNLTLDPEGDEETFYADNIQFFSSVLNDGYSGTLEMANIPEWFYTEYLGYKLDTKKRLVETDDIGGNFALLYQVETDTKEQKFCNFNCNCGRPKSEHKTIEKNREITTSSLDIKVIGEQIEDKKVTKMLSTPTSEDYATFYTKVDLPSFAVVSG